MDNILYWVIPFMFSVGIAVIIKGAFFSFIKRRKMGIDDKEVKVMMIRHVLIGLAISFLSILLLTLPKITISHETISVMLTRSLGYLLGFILGIILVRSVTYILKK